jgi:hypothetical protein
VDGSIPTPELRNYGETYMGNASVLNGTMYNAQYGWMVEGFWSPPPGSSIWIEQTSATAGLMAYSGGTMMNQGTFAPIFGTAGSSPRIMWDGRMLHNWYAVTSPGRYSATYRIYFGDGNGVATPGYDAGEVVLRWIAGCLADTDNGTGTGTPDGGVTIDDLLYYLSVYEQGATAADMDDGSGTGTPDGGVTIDDLLYFLMRFEAGC